MSNIVIGPFGTTECVSLLVDAGVIPPCDKADAVRRLEYYHMPDQVDAQQGPTFAFLEKALEEQRNQQLIDAVGEIGTHLCGIDTVAKGDGFLEVRASSPNGQIVYANVYADTGDGTIRVAIVADDYLRQNDESVSYARLSPQVSMEANPELLWSYLYVKTINFSRPAPSRAKEA